MKAYDIVLQRDLARDAPTASGWCFGLPPGIAPSQWPLDPESGYPLQHGFTLVLPEDYRVQGPDIAAISFFSVAPDHNDGGPLSTEGLSDLILSPGEAPPVDAALKPFWDHARAGHPRLHRMTDDLGCCYAVIPLTKGEAEGPLCQPPEIANHPMLTKTERPGWLDKGSAAAFWGEPNVDVLGLKVEETYQYKMMQGVPDHGLEFCLPFTLSERLGDPNAGKRAVESWDEGGPDGYESPFTEEFEVKAWVKDLAPNHLGGTMMPIQAVPEFSPYYIEFDEYFGGYNFGSGNAQLDLKGLEFDWAC